MRQNYLWIRKGKKSYLWFIPKYNKIREKDEDSLDAQTKLNINRMCLFGYHTYELKTSSRNYVDFVTSSRNYAI
jgi:hypothetical protein